MADDDGDAYGKFIRKKMQKLAEHITKVTHSPGQEEKDYEYFKKNIPQNGD